ncbi:MAG: hypothetical protein ACXADC_13705 [Candidatus Thorarchaeota archaeon]
MGKNQNLTIATIVFPSKSAETNTLLLVESIRDLAGAFSEVPIKCYLPHTGRQLSKIATKKLLDLDAKIIPFEINRDILRFPFMRHAYAASIAESAAEKEANCMGWVAPNTLILHEPKCFSLGEGLYLGYRPVHHKLLGMEYDEPLDPFWTEVYQQCKVPADRIFKMRTQIEDLAIRPYFNAGLLIVRPERGILRAWRETFVKVHREGIFQDYYKKDERYAVFVHQAILSGVILSTLKPAEMIELPSNYNYPLNLYEEDNTKDRPSFLEECVTIRHEGFYQDANWMDKMPARDELKKWIAARLM